MHNVPEIASPQSEGSMGKAGLALLIMLSMAETACDIPDRISNLEKQNRELQEEVNKRQAAVDFDLQAKCSRDSKEWFKENFASDKDTMYLRYENHYNKSLNKCFISVEWHYTMGAAGSWMNDMTVWDVYENTRYGNFSEHHQIDYKSSEGVQDKVYACSVLNQKCKALGEFSDLVRPYMNN